MESGGRFNRLFGFDPKCRETRRNIPKFGNFNEVTFITDVSESRLLRYPYAFARLTIVICAKKLYKLYALSVNRPLESIRWNPYETGV